LASTTVTGTAFVSLPPGTVPDAEEATVVNSRTQQTIVPLVLDGGFDPVQILAEPGDTIVTTMRAGSSVLAYAKSLVPVRSRPRVVRTSPSRGRRDVAINSIITVIFSEPIDTASLTPTSLTLVQGSDTITGAILATGGSPVSAAFRPEDPLAYATQYSLLFSPDIRDASGDRLEVEAPVVFSTVADPVAPAAPPPPSPPGEPGPPSSPDLTEGIPAGARLEFVTQPANVVAFSAFDPAVRIALVDENGVTIADHSGDVSIGLAPPTPSSGGLAGWGLHSAFVAGIATFDGLRIDVPGTYALLASIAEGITANSRPFTVSEAPWSGVYPQAVPPTRRYATSAVAEGSLSYIGGILDWDEAAAHTARVDAYDPVTNTWKARAPLPRPRSRAGAGVVDGILYVVGGADPKAGWTGSVYAYDPMADTWTERAPMPTPLQHPGIGVVNGILYAIGGYDPSAAPVRTVAAYDPSSDTWTLKAPMPTARMSPGIAVADGVLYAIGGNGSEIRPLETVEAYDPAADAWTTRRPIPNGRDFMGIAATGGLIYVIGGYAFNGQFGESIFQWVGEVSVYDPIQDRWSAGPPLPVGGGETMAGVVAGVVHAMPLWGGMYALGASP
jgi:N-acetylneuraminic acid mutarotase